MPQTFGGYALYGPSLVRQYRAHYGRDTVRELALANSLYVPSGRWPARGWLLMRREDYDRIDPYSTALELVIDDFVHGHLTLKHLTVVQARCVSTGVASSPDAVYLVEVTDKRGTLHSPWFRQGTTSQYNVRAPAYPGEFYTSTLNAGVAWTWDGLVENLWNQMPALGTYTSIPTAPAGTPEGWRFPGCGAWEALNAVLEQVGLTIAVDLASDKPYTIVVPGAADDSFTAFAAANIPEDDFAYLDAGSGRAPGSVVVYFHRRNEYYGTEETIRRDSLQWSTTPLYSVTVTATGAGFPTFVTAAGVHHLWSDFTVRYDVDGNPLAADVAAAATVAANQAAAYYTLAQRATSGYMRKVFTGAQRLATSGQIDGVRWFQTMLNPERAGWRMEVCRGYVWPECQFKTDFMGLTSG